DASNVVSLINKENAILELGTNNTPMVTLDPSGVTSFAGQLKIPAGNPGTGKILTSDASGLATWSQAPSSGVSSVNGDAGIVTQSFSLNDTSLIPSVVGSGTNAVTLNLPKASTSKTGVLDSNDFETFTNKLSGTMLPNRIPKGAGNFNLDLSMMTDNGTSIGVNTTSPNASALLHLNSGNKGILIPQVSIDSLADVLSIPSPANGLLVYNTVQPGIKNDMARGYYYYSTNSSTWVRLADNLNDNKWQKGGLLGIKLRDTVDGVEMMDNYTGSALNWLPKVKILKLLDSTSLNAKNNINALVISGVNRKPTAGWEFRQKTSILLENSYQSTGNTSGTNTVAISAYTENPGTTANNFFNGLAFYTFASPNNTAVADTPSIAMLRHNVAIGAYATDINNVTEGRLQITGFSNGDQLSLRHPSSINLKWGLYVSSIDSSLNFYSNGSLRANIDRVTGVYSALSDRNYKKDIVALAPVLEKINRLKAYNYRYLDCQESDRKVNGFMAQDLLSEFPELVYQRYDRTIDKPLYTVDYSGFGVLAIKAIQEQQAIIEQQQTEIDVLKQQQADILKRLNALEKK
ncbi:MAG TPA: tail fiber domain-containing protein, partial [Chitinophagaceae bacterium]|nr:tail fiber domain-containing protein [Chitinophagaceae bacterium]